MSVALEAPSLHLIQSFDGLLVHLATRLATDIRTIEKLLRATIKIKLTML
jgi:hypothetical protein